MKKTFWKRVSAFALAAALLCAVCAPGLADAALRAYINNFAATVDSATQQTNGLKFTIGAQNGSGSYSFTYNIAGPVSVSGSASAGTVSVPGTFPSGSYTVMVTANDGASSASAALTGQYTNNLSTFGMVLSGQSYPIKYVTGITLNETGLSLDVGGTAQLTATVAPDDANNKSVGFASGNEAVATVSASGLITAVGPGSCDIACAAKDGSGISAICRVTVTQRVGSISLNRTACTLSVNDTITLSATVLPANASNKGVVFTSSNTSVATVNASTGEVTARSGGNAVITAMSQDGTQKTATCNVTVGVKVTGVSVSPKTVNMTTGGSTTLSASVVPDDASNKSVAWSSSDTTVATVDALGKVTAYKAGSAVITATAADGSGASDGCTLSVTGATVNTPAPATSTPTGGSATPTPGGSSATLVPGSANIPAKVQTADGKGLNLRVEARKSAKRLLVIPNLSNVIVNVKGGTWCHVTYNGTSGYVMTQFLSFNGGSTATSTPSGGGSTATATPSGGSTGTGNAQVKTKEGGLNLRADTSKASKRLLVIPQNAYVNVLVYGSTWCQVSYNGVTGYVMTQFLSVSGSVTTAAPSGPVATKPVSSAGSQYAQVTTAQGGLNLRTGMSTENRRIAIIPRNGYLLVNTYGATWCHVTYNGVSGYVMTKFLTLI